MPQVWIFLTAIHRPSAMSAMTPSALRIPNATIAWLRTQLRSPPEQCNVVNHHVKMAQCLMRRDTDSNLNLSNFAS